MTATPHGDALDTLLAQRLGSVRPFASLAAIVAAAPELRCLGAETSASLLAGRNRIAAAMQPGRLGALAFGLAQCMRRHLADRFQYVTVDAHDDALLLERYGALLARFKDATGIRAPTQLCDAVNRELGHHHDYLRDWVRSKLRDAGALDWFERGGADAVCAHYTPATQMDVLGLLPSRLMSPILDLGCGPEARLVRYIRSLGIEDVVGIDRNGDGGVAARGDWFGMTLPPRTWGTILAHQSFSLHFTQAHLRSSAAAASFARVYMGILAALKPGGTFAYAPALPFIEAHLPQDRFVVRIRPVRAARLSANVTPAATQVTRIG